VREPNRSSNAAETIGMTSPPTPVPENMLGVSPMFWTVQAEKRGTYMPVARPLLFCHHSKLLSGLLVGDEPRTRTSMTSWDSTA